MITDDILKDISGALSKKIKKDFTKYKEYSICLLYTSFLEQKKAVLRQQQYMRNAQRKMKKKY